MISDKVFELINRDLDGALSAKEKVQLEKHLQSDSDTRELLAKLRLLHTKLLEVSETEPPADLKETVMKSLPVVRYSKRNQPSPVASKIIELFQVPRFQMVGMFSLGAAAALLFLVISQNLSNSPLVPAEQVIGTILAPGKTGNAEQIESKQFAIDDYKADISTSRSKDKVIVNINLQSESNQPVQPPVQLVVTSDATGDFRLNALDYDAPNLIYANFGNDFFSATIGGSGSWVLVFDDREGTAETLEIELKTESSFIREVFPVQRRTLTKD